MGLSRREQIELDHMFGASSKFKQMQDDSEAQKYYDDNNPSPLKGFHINWNNWRR
jgi:hypothetical protein